MMEEHKRDQEPWYPKIEHEPLLNPFENPLDRTSESDNPVKLAEPDAEEEASVAGDRVERETPPSAESAPAAEIKPAE